MKPSNFFTAYKTTIIGFVITVLTSVYQAMASGPINWKAIGTAVLANAILAFTDILKEAKK